MTLARRSPPISAAARAMQGGRAFATFGRANKGSSNQALFEGDAQKRSETVEIPMGGISKNIRTPFQSPLFRRSDTSCDLLGGWAWRGPFQELPFMHDSDPWALRDAPDYG